MTKWDIVSLHKRRFGLRPINSIVEKLLDPTIFGNEITITTSFRQELNENIEEYKQLSDNSDYHFILNDIKDDIIFYSNKTTSQVIQEMN